MNPGQGAESVGADAAQEQIARSLVYERTVLPGGVRVLTSTLPHTYAVNVSFLFGAGSRYESEELAGASHLFEHLLFKGTARRPTPRQISETVEGVGGSINAFTDREVTGYWCRMARPHYRAGIDLLGDMVLNSLFRESDIMREKQVVYEEIRAVHDSPGGRASEIQDQLLWPDQPMGRDVAGSVESVSAISRESMLEYLHTQYAASNTVIAVAGNVGHDEVVAQVEEVMGDLPDGETLPLIPFVDNLRGPQVKVDRRDTEQAHLSLGIKGVSMFDKDRHALGLFSVILGESMSSRLFEEVREKRGLAYDIHSGVSVYNDCGSLTIGSGVDPERAAEAVPIIVEVVKGLGESVTDVELSQAKELSKGRLLLRMEDGRSVVSSMGAQELLRGEVRTVPQLIGDLESVEVEDLVRVAERLIRPENTVLAIVGPFDSVEPFLSSLEF